MKLIAILLVLQVAGILGREISYESSEYDEVALGSSEEGISDESLALAMGYDPATDGTVEEWWKKIHDEAGGARYPESFKQQAYQTLKNQQLPEPTQEQMKKVDMKMNMAEVQRHNELRALHGAQPVEYDPKIAAYAQNYANYIAYQMSQGAPFQHNPDTKVRGLGENMAGDFEKPNYKGDYANMWYFREISDYKRNGNQPSKNPATGHFTQVVWAGTKKMGCGRACSSRTSCLVICNYYPAGNVQSMDGSNSYYQQNVNMKMSKPAQTKFNGYKNNLSDYVTNNGDIKVDDA